MVGHFYTNFDWMQEFQKGKDFRAWTRKVNPDDFSVSVDVSNYEIEREIIDENTDFFVFKKRIFQIKYEKLNQKNN